MDVDAFSEARREIRKMLREGLELWTAAGKDARRYKGGSFTATVTYDKHPDMRSTDPWTTTQRLEDNIFHRIDK